MTNLQATLFKWEDHKLFPLQEQGCQLIQYNTVIVNCDMLSFSTAVIK